MTEKNRKYVFPLLLDLHYVKNDVLKTCYKIVNHIEAANIIVVPLEYSYSMKKYNNIVQDLINQALKIGKPIWVYSGGDFGYSLKNQNVYNFRFSGFKSKLNRRTFLLPAFVNDPYGLHINKEFSTINKQPKPKIGFVGQAKGGFLKYLKELLSFAKTNIKRFVIKQLRDYQAFYPSITKRAKYLELLKKSNHLQTHFILRNSYRAGVKTLAEKHKTTQEFYQNIYNNPYTFCLRGAGNFSVRFYEVLATGRIPILINTDCLLPLDNKINWDKHCLIINEANIKTMPETIVQFHAKLSNQDFLKLQKSNRELWNNYLRRHTYFKEVHDIFCNILN
ncbi:exostosin domain-containing protein [Aequorivita marisscotiae]|uniref:Exostosin GT47 domain-containing protein n=1 Tax=Aequorivita marisscotiae TaxID=3040348 RepID=A0ABY8KUK5_9FLAO|nr:exostosin family protein [Aequorivita sp. Ant34-E75]WGF92732.1 hypothetical protein QCQ61_00750 [Aequorivita sp. Ant34-E75]